MKFLKVIFDVHSKTFWGTLLGLVALFIDSANFFPNVPKEVLVIIQVIGFAFAFFGLVDAAEQSEKTIIDKAKAFFATNIFAGIVLELLTDLLDKLPSMPNIPHSIIVAGQIIGAILMAMGLRQKIAQGRAMTTPPALTAKEKYKNLLAK